MVEAKQSPKIQQPSPPMSTDLAQVKVSERYLQNRILAMQTHLEQLSSNWVLTTDMAVQQPFETEFTCAICYNVVKKPRQCKECDRLQCGSCLTKWWERALAGTSHNKCPLCSKTKGFNTKVNNIVMSWLNQKQFKCNLCQQTFSYEHFEEHMRKGCEVARFRPDCQLCGTKDFENEDAIIEHWRNECPRMKVVCVRCSIEFHRDEPHDCVEALLDARLSDKRLIEELREQIALLKRGVLGNRGYGRALGDNRPNQSFLVGRYQRPAQVVLPPSPQNRNPGNMLEPLIPHQPVAQD